MSLAVLSSVPAFAQSAPAPDEAKVAAPEDAATADDDASKKEGAIIVTGSHRAANAKFDRSADIGHSQ